MCVSDTKAAEQVLFGADGVEQSLASGMIIADSSTISPSATVRFAERVKARGVDYADAPMTGSKIAAEAGSLIFMVGAADAVLARLQPLFQAMAMNLQIALIFEGFAEGLTLAAKLGVDVEKMLPLIQASMVRSGVVEYKAPFILKRDFSPNFPLRLMLKDIRLALDAAKESRVRLPGLEAVEEVYDVAAEEGQGDLDYASTLTLLEKWAGVEVTAAASK
jgi:3-hydroxyisobutyrate dehydrogenase/2-hydroxy-3-oxopropionate reductase